MSNESVKQFILYCAEVSREGMLWAEPVVGAGYTLNLGFCFARWVHIDQESLNTFIIL
jgi:hypothetical protein